ncbi:pol protein [Cucumis melo var. makuwa]|uniref:Pol protein n=1 Tax=Cucumis melo var. makuwa TaxID=1194695 RepID=A0A5D3D5P1_CUCMM|nr:pol protein [Cucumis melo var. makuwa]
MQGAKSYADVRRKDLEFNVGDKVFLKVAPMKGVLRFEKKGKLSPRFVGPFEILERICPVAYPAGPPSTFSFFFSSSSNRQHPHPSFQAPPFVAAIVAKALLLSWSCSPKPSRVVTVSLSVQVTWSPSSFTCSVHRQSSFLVVSPRPLFVSRCVSPSRAPNPSHARRPRRFLGCPSRTHHLSLCLSQIRTINFSSEQLKSFPSQVEPL